MKELDFDELDRAVSSLMAGATSSTPSEPTEKVLTIPTTIDDNDSSAAPANVSVVPQNDTTSAPARPSVVSTPQPQSQQQPVRPPQAPLAARRSGRFMDVVRPADIKPATPRPSREGVAISAPVATPEIAEASPRTEEVKLQDEADESVSSWPDPIDFHKGEVTTQPEPDTLAQATDVVKPITDTVPEVSEPLQTPFIADAKVEKRPLGGFAQPKPAEVADVTTEAHNETAESEATPATDDPQITTDAAATVLPEELKSDIVAIESDTTADATKVEMNNTSAPVQSAPAIATVAQASIRQQYQEGVSTTPAEHAPIYDSEPIQPPLAHPVKKKTGWLVVLLIIGLLILGAAAGTAIYFFVL